jgi:hypothetical protein
MEVDAHAKSIANISSVQIFDGLHDISSSITNGLNFGHMVNVSKTIERFHPTYIPIRNEEPRIMGFAFVREFN